MSCPFIVSWVGVCNKPGNPYCEKHAEVKCECGNQATADCGQTLGPFVCGFPLCDRCKVGHAQQHEKQFRKDMAAREEAQKQHEIEQARETLKKHGVTEL